MTTGKKRGVVKGTKRAQYFLCMLAVGKGKVEAEEIESISEDAAIKTFEAMHNSKPTMVKGPYRKVRGAAAKPTLFISVSAASINFMAGAPIKATFKGWPCTARSLKGFTDSNGISYADGDTAFVSLDEAAPNVETRKPRASSPVLPLSALILEPTVAA
jgi:hypothetical protein